MSFLAPLFLLGTLAIGLPLLFHMVRQSTRERVVFSTLMFLSPAPPRLTRRSRIEHWLLLILRALIVALLAFAFSRPFFPGADFTSGSESAPRQRLILLDVSGSMRHPDVWQQAQTKVRTLLQEAAPGDQMALMTFARSMETVVSLEEWNEWGIEERVPLALARLERIQPGWEGTRLGDSLMDAAEWFLQLPPSTDTSATPQRQIEVVSDIQQGARHEVLANFDWPSEILVDIHPMERPKGANAGIHWIPEQASEQSTAASASRVRIQNAAHSTSELFQVGWSIDDPADMLKSASSVEATFHGPAVDAYVPPGQSRIITLPEAPDGVQPTSVLLKGDDDPFDNRSHRVPPVQVVSTLHYFGAPQAAANDPKHPAFFLQRALPVSRYQAMEMRFHETDIAPVDLEFTKDESRRDVFLIAGPLPANTTRQLHSMVVEGRSAIVLLTDASPAMARTLSSLLGLSVEDPDATTGLNIEEVNPPRYALLGELDFSHPLLVPFADPRYSDFTKIHIWKHRRIRPDAIPSSHVVAWFDSRDPAIVDVSVGTGRLLLFTTGWQPADSQLALSTKFVPLVHSLLDLSGTLLSKPPSPIVGDSLNPEGLGWPSSIAATLRWPDGSRHSFNSSSTVSGDAPNPRLSYPMPGIYTIESVPPELRQSVQIAVQLDPAETRTEALPVDALEPFGILSTAQAVARQAGAQAAQVQRQAAETEKRQKVWRWALATALAGLLLESWFAGWSARRPASAQSPATPETHVTA